MRKKPERASGNASGSRLPITRKDVPLSEINKLMGGSENDPFTFPRFSQALMRKALLEPFVDVFSTKDEVVATVELPGVHKEDIALKVSPNAMVISVKKGEREERREPGSYEYSARFEGYSQTIPLPSKVVSGKAKATYKNGVLEIRIPKEGTSSDEGGKVEIE